MDALRLLDKRVASAFYGQFTSLRPIQEAAIAPILQRRNVILSSGTGSGKTEAVLAPLLSLHWLNAIKTESLKILYVAPTKALVNDIEKRLILPFQRLHLMLGVRHGDRDDLIRKTPHMLITTPESLEVLFIRKDRNLKTVDAIVIDEVHLLYNTQRGLQLSTLLCRLRQLTGKMLQWAALSATAGDMTNIQTFLSPSDEHAEFIHIPAEREIDTFIAHIRNEDDLLRLVNKTITGCTRSKLLLFGNSRRACERLTNILKRDKSFRANVFTHYSSLSAELRVETESRYAAAKIALCVATSTLELGIDIGDIDAVVLWGAPGGVESFLQRLGRGNRRRGKTNAICLIPDDSTSPIFDALRFWALMDASSKGKLPERDPYDLYGAAAQQCLSVIAANGGKYTRVADICAVFGEKEHLRRKHIEEILSELERKGYIRRHGFKNQYGADDKLYELVDYRLIYGNFEANSQSVDIYQETKILGAVPAINLLRIKPGMTVRFAGKVWKVLRATAEGYKLEPARIKKQNDASDFMYPGGKIGIDAFLCNRIWEMIFLSDLPKTIMASDIYDKVADFITKVKKSCSIDSIPFSKTDRHIQYVTFGGLMVNKALGLDTQRGDFIADDISLRAEENIRWMNIEHKPDQYENIFHRLFEASEGRTLYQTLLPDKLQLQEMSETWLKDKSIEAILHRLSVAEPVEVAPDLFNNLQLAR